jgi:hypothetical protein
MHWVYLMGVLKKSQVKSQFQLIGMARQAKIL